MGKKSITDIVAIVVSELTDLTSDERKRVIQASLMLLGEPQINSPPIPSSIVPDEGGADSNVPVRARTWIRQSGLSFEQLNQVFHFGNDGIEVIASEIPGKNYRAMTRNTYVLCGISKLLTSGEARFDDKIARELCERFGAYDQTNHAKYMKAGNEFTGSKEKGWVLTAPGLKQGAILISELSAA